MRRAPTSSRTPRDGSSTSARPRACASACRTTSRTREPAAPHRADGGHRRDGRVDPGAQRRRSADARVQPHQAAPAPVQHPAARRQELSVPRRHDERRVAPGHGHAGREAQGRPLLRALRPRLRHPRDARPAAAHVPDPHLLGQQVQPPPEAGPALPAVPHREVLGAVRRRDRRRTTTTSWCRSCIEFLDGDTDAIVKRLETEMREAADELEFERAARLRDRLTSGAQGHREAADGGRPPRTST